MDVAEYEKPLEKIELLTDIQTAESQLNKGEGISHEEAKRKVLEKIRKWKLFGHHIGAEFWISLSRFIEEIPALFSPKNGEKRPEWQCL